MKQTISSAKLKSIPYPKQKQKEAKKEKENKIKKENRIKIPEWGTNYLNYEHN